MNRIDIVVDGEKRLSFSATLNLESFEELQISLAKTLEEAVSMLRAPKAEGFPKQDL